MEDENKIVNFDKYHELKLKVDETEKIKKELIENIIFSIKEVWNLYTKVKEHKVQTSNPFDFESFVNGSTKDMGWGPVCITDVYHEYIVGLEIIYDIFQHNGFKITLNCEDINMLAYTLELEDLHTDALLKLYRRVLDIWGNYIDQVRFVSDLYKSVDYIEKQISETESGNA